MSENIQKAELPHSELGESRCIEFGYFGHGDIVISSWVGPLDHEPRTNDGISSRFGFAHGNDVVILASMAGYLARTAKEKAEISEVMLAAGEDILNDGDDDLLYYDSLRSGSLRSIAGGKPLKRYDEPKLVLECLVLPTPSQPGLIEETGGTGIYTHLDSNRQMTLMVFGRHAVTRLDDGKRTASLTETTEFCEQDIPTMASLVCNLALGDYRRDIHALLVSEFRV